MDRKKFIKSFTAGSMGAAALGMGSSVSAKKDTKVSMDVKKPLMKVGCQSRMSAQTGTSKETLEYFARHGVFHINPGPPRSNDDGIWDLDHARQQVEEAAEYGISIWARHLPLTSGERYTEEGIDNIRFPNIMLGNSPERDREIEDVQKLIEVAGRSGLPRLMYNTTILPVLRTGRTVDPTRGNASYSTWDYEEALRTGMDQETTLAGRVDNDEIFERITYMLDRILPVAEEYNVKLANHIADPPVADFFQGIMRWNSPDVFEQIKKFAELYDSPSHGFHFCVGSVGEGLEDPYSEIIPIVKWVGERNQLFNIHLRNIKGGFGYFEEVYPDNGDMNFVQVMRALRDVEYEGMVMPDHVPQHEDPESGRQAFVFGYGYIKALIQMLEDEAGYWNPDHRTIT